MRIFFSIIVRESVAILISHARRVCAGKHKQPVKQVKKQGSFFQQVFSSLRAMAGILSSVPYSYWWSGLIRMGKESGREEG